MLVTATSVGLLVDTAELDWIRLDDGASYKLLRVSEESGAWTMLVSAPAGTTNSRHRHLGPADFYVLEGRIDYAGGSAGAGAWVYEPVGAVHEATHHPEDTVYLANIYGPLEVLDAHNRTVTVIDAFRFRRMLDAARG